MKRAAELAAILSLAASAAANAEPLAGRASVIDGDTIEIHGARIRLEGIDAPESRQTCMAKETGEVVRCGQKAAFFLADLLAEHTVTCTEAGKDRYRRTLAHCEVEGQDVARRWSARAGRSPLSGTAGSTCRRKRRRARPAWACGLPSSSRPGTGGRARDEGATLDLARRAALEALDWERDPYAPFGWARRTERTC